MKRMTIRTPRLLFACGLLALTAAVWVSYIAMAGNNASQPVQTSPIHPAFALLDANGTNVLQSGAPVSTMKTCGACHETEFIASHSSHALAGSEQSALPGEVPGGQPWETSSGIFGAWDALQYRYLTPPGDERLDLSTAGWIMEFGGRHVGGGPAVISREGKPLTSLQPDASNPEASLLNPLTGEAIAWDWQQSGVVEMNCFLCHTPNPNNQARTQALQEGRFAWANTATLLGSGIVETDGEQLIWNPQAFDAEGKLKENYVAIQDPTNENCGACHGIVHTDSREPLVAIGCTAENWNTQTTGQIISPQRMSESGMNLAGKEELARSWDVHAERSVNCTDCHYSLNNPVYFQDRKGENPDHLEFDPRRLELGEYLKQPLHQFANSPGARNGIAEENATEAQGCESCHDALQSHAWLPYGERHMAALACETCHVPKVYAPAVQQVDWTVIRPDANPSIGSGSTVAVAPSLTCRGLSSGTTSSFADIRSLIEGYEPVLLPRQDGEKDTRLAPYNLITAWYWVYGDPPRPVRLLDLKNAWLDGEQYHPEVLAAFDQDGNGDLNTTELVINTPQKEELIAKRLSALGLENPRIVGEIQAYSINHTIASGEWAIRDCQTCHSDESRMVQTTLLASYAPGGKLPEYIANGRVRLDGEMVQGDSGQLLYIPATTSSSLYVLGHHRVTWIDTLGALMFMGVLAAISVHAGLRYLSSKQRSHRQLPVETVYMYSVYERFWHWLQTFVIVLLLLTGIVIHSPDSFGFLSFRGVVLTHNVLAAILAINAALSLFYHLASGEIKQYIPRPRGFFDQAIEQAVYYLRGIFRGEPHPFEKTPHKKLNPLQQATYFAILNILLPLQGLTGILMWGAQRWSNLSNALGGLPFLAPAHTLIAWMFAAFIVAHAYLTTTGPEPLAGIKAMMMGWEEVETPHTTQEVSEA